MPFPLEVPLMNNYLADLAARLVVKFLFIAFLYFLLCPLVNWLCGLLS